MRVSFVFLLFKNNGYEGKALNCRGSILVNSVALHRDKHLIPSQFECKMENKKEKKPIIISLVVAKERKKLSLNHSPMLPKQNEPNTQGAILILYCFNCIKWVFI